ncbi:ABC transporter ATP-binding protein, partial [Bordetella pertussis]
MSHLVLDDLTKQYGEAAAISGVSFTAPAGSFTVLLGPSGCGKSTTLRMIAGLDTPTSGRIRIGDRDVTDLPPAKRRISMVFQSYALFPHLSVRENILFGLKVRKEPARDYERRLARVAGLLGLQALLDRKPAQLSGGQQQRVALARALVYDLRILLLDEPLSALDKKLRADLQWELRKLNKESGASFLYVTHDQEEALSMSDRIAIFNEGGIAQIGSPTELYERPANLFVAGFLGRSNVLAGKVRQAGADGVAVEYEGGVLEVPKPRRQYAPRLGHLQHAALVLDR